MVKRKTFLHRIPARTFEHNGGDLTKSKIVDYIGTSTIGQRLVRRERNVLYITDGGMETKTHLDCCEVLVEIII